MKMNHSILHAILWAAAILASALLHGPLDLTFILTLLAGAAIIATDERASAKDCARPPRLAPENR